MPDPLEIILAAERAALLAGDFEKLAQIAARKSAYLEGPITARAARLAQDNQTLLQSAQAGLSAAAARVRGLLGKTSAFDAYGKDGGRTPLRTDGGAGRRV